MHDKSTHVKIGHLQPHPSRLSVPKAICISGSHQLHFLVSLLLVRAYRACIIARGQWIAYWQKDGCGWKNISAAHSPKSKFLHRALDVCVLNGSILSGSLPLWLYTRWVCTFHLEARISADLFHNFRISTMIFIESLWSILGERKKTLQHISTYR